MPEDIKRQIKDYWDAVPCGTRGIVYPEGTLEYYEAVMKNRQKKEYFLDGFAQFDKYAGKRVLEIGCGVGSDLIRFAQNGANVTGIDLSSKSVLLTRKRLELYGLKGEVYEADVECLPFNGSTFDLVFSCGVLHHTPDMKQAVKEAYRVLKPNGDIRVMLYHKPSVVCLQMWLLFGLLEGRPFRHIDDILFHHHESVGTKVLTVSEARDLFADFRQVDIRTIVTKYDIRYKRDRYLPAWVMRLIPSCLGWNILIRGKK